MELPLYKEYRDVVGLFTYVVETERRFYLANSVDVKVRSADGEVYFELTMTDAWVWDIYRSARFVKNVRVVTFKDVNVEELPKTDIKMPEGGDFADGGCRPRSSTPPRRGAPAVHSRVTGPVPTRPAPRGWSAWTSRRVTSAGTASSSPAAT